MSHKSSPHPGYDTTTTSPDSARSSFSSPKEFIPRASVLPELPPTNPDLSQLVMDPVKLIDERIKVHCFNCTLVECTVELLNKEHFRTNMNYCLERLFSSQRFKNVLEV